MNRVVQVTVLVMLAVGVVTIILLTLISRSADVGRTRVTVTTAHQDNDCTVTTSTPRRRFSTTDEMRYILYGAGDQSSAYDHRLIDYIRSHISQPSMARPRQLATQKDTSQAGQAVLVDKLLSRRRSGFFVECGAADGEKFSNSLFFELERNWTGLLIEANPAYHRALLDKNRRAYVLGSCLSTERRPTTVHMQPAGVLGGIVDKIHPSHLSLISATNKPQVIVNCFPLNAIMAALDVSRVDYLSLDVEGPELEILQTVNWTRLHIAVITVEYRILGGSIGIDQAATLQKLKDLRQFFHNTGIYREVAVLPAGDEVNGLDVVFSRF